MHQLNVLRFTAMILAIQLMPNSARGIDVVVDYRYDTNSFFDPTNPEGQLARDALEAAAERYSDVISTSLRQAVLRDNNDDPRIGFTHPGTGNSYQISAAGSVASDVIVTVGGQPATEYSGGFTLAEDEWILFAGGRPLTSAGIGGTGTGTNFSDIYGAGDSHLNRGFRSSGSVGNLPVWGGAISFDNSNDRDWHFDHTTAADGGKLDFYTIALHEIGHVLGLASSWNEWEDNSTGNSFVGSETVAAYNRDNGLQLNALDLQSVNDGHWVDGVYQSHIFSAANPNLVGTAGLDSLQDLLMEPIANFTQSVRRFELTNVDVAALKDIGWSINDTQTVSCDFTNDQICDIADLNYLLADIREGTAPISERDQWLADAANQQGHPAPFLLGDANLDGIVDAADLNIVGQNWNMPTGTWNRGDFDASGETNASDLNVLGIHWRQSNYDGVMLAPHITSVPEPRPALPWLAALYAMRRRRCSL